MLLHTEYSLLSLLHTQDGVVHHHGLFQVSGSALLALPGVVRATSALCDAQYSFPAGCQDLSRGFGIRLGPCWLLQYSQCDFSLPGFVTNDNLERPGLLGGAAFLREKKEVI